uniref:RING-type E3 ubiquitin transferase n=1 Tax=Myripristis murdjan TaxID=586833 RepID=A0A667XR88_9TELE
LWVSIIWSCLILTATVEETGSSWHQASTNLGFSPSLTCPTHLCKACGGHLDTHTREHVCLDCKKTFCGHCSVQLEPTLRRLCHTCRRFHGTLFNRTKLMRLKVRELRDYLHLHEVPTQTCREKEELVDLVLDQLTPRDATVFQSGCDNGPIFPAAGGPASTDSQPQETSQSGFEAQSHGQSTDSEEGLMPGRRASLSDLSRVEDIEGLSVRQLKEILARNFVNFKGCCEKWELMERVTRLYNDYKDLQNQDSVAAKRLDENLCRICMDSPIDCVLLECGHMVTCSRCGKRMNECPICRQYVVRAVHVFRS